MQSCCFGFEQHRGRWAVFSAAFHHAERAPRVTSSLTAESPTIRSFKTSLVSVQGFSPPGSCAQGRLVNAAGIFTTQGPAKLPGRSRAADQSLETTGSLVA